MMKPCCSNPKLGSLSHKKFEISSEGGYVEIPLVNKICLNCYSHWYGHPDSVKFFTKKEWDKWIEEA